MSCGPPPLPLLIVPGWVSAMIEAGQKLALINEILTTGGTADASDARLVARELERMPLGALQIMRDNGTRVVTCRNSVVEIFPSLATQQPRSWDPGDTWSSVPGLYDPSSNQVVIATVGHGTAAGPHVPVTGEGHGSANLVIHESFHAVDQGGGGQRSASDADFNAARTADLATLPQYEANNDGGLAASQQETYSESAARYYGGDPDDATNHPNLHNYWATHPPTP